MKKIVFTVTLIAGVLAGAMTLSAFSKSEPNTIVSTEKMADGCSFVVTDASPSIYNTTVTIKVYVEAAFTPSENGSYTVVVKPEGRLYNILDSQSKSLKFSYNTKNGWSKRMQYVEFYCSVNDNTYNQCNSNSFSVSSCYKN